MSTLKRYRPYYFDPLAQRGHAAEMRQNTDGPYVAHADHVRAMKEAEALAKTLREKNSQVTAELSTATEELERLKELMLDVIDAADEKFGGKGDCVGMPVTHAKAYFGIEAFWDTREVRAQRAAQREAKR
jgi:hypothetical protein